MTENDLAREIVHAAYRVHAVLGPGLLESVYRSAMAYELEKRGLQTSQEHPVPVIYESIRIQTGFRADLLVEDQVIVEIKSLEAIAPVHKKQLLTYLKVADKRLGLLINFNEVLIKHGINESYTDSKNKYQLDEELPQTHRQPYVTPYVFSRF